MWPQRRADKEVLPKERVSGNSNKRIGDFLPMAASMPIQLIFPTPILRALQNAFPEGFRNCYGQSLLCISHSSLFWMSISILVILHYYRITYSVQFLGHWTIRSYIKLRQKGWIQTCWTWSLVQLLDGTLYCVLWGGCKCVQYVGEEWTSSLMARMAHCGRHD